MSNAKKFTVAYTVTAKSSEAHHLLGYSYTVTDNHGGTVTFYGSEFERLLPGKEISVGFKFYYTLDKDDNEEMFTI